MASNTVEIRITATGAEQAAKVLQGVATAGGNIGSATVKGAKDAETVLTGFKGRLSEVSSVAQQAGINTGRFGQAISALSSPLGLAAVGVGILTAGIIKATSAVVENAQQVKELMAVSGLSAEAADNLADTFQILGKNTSDLNTSLFRMSAEIDSGGASFRNLGIDIRNTAGQLKTEGALFLEVRDRISDIASASQRAAVAQDIFGRGARQLADVFAMSREEFRKWQDEGGRMSGWTEQQHQSAIDYTREVARLTMQFDAFWIAVGSPLVSTGASLLKWVNDAIRAARELTVVWEALSFAFGSPIENALLDQINKAEEDYKKLLALFAQEGKPAVDFLPTRVVEEIKALQRQLDLLRATDAQRPIVALNLALKEFADKNGPAAAAAAAKVFGGLMDEAKAKAAVATAVRVFDQLSQKANESAAVQVRATQEAMASRLLAEEEGAIRLAQLRATTLGEELAALKANLPLAIAAGPDARYAAETQIAAKTTALYDAISGAVVLTKKKETADILADLVFRQTKEEQTAQQSLALAESQSARRLALIEMSGASEIEIAEEAYQNAVDLALRRGAVEQIRIQQEQERAKGTLLIQRDLDQKLLELSGQSVANTAKVNAEILAADTARRRATVVAEQAMYDEIRAMEQAERQKRGALVEQTPRFQAMAAQDTIDRLNEMAAEAETMEQRQALLTLVYIAESKKRTAALLTDAQTRLLADAEEVNDAAQHRHRLVDAEIAVQAARLSTINKAASDELAIRAGVIDKLARERQRDVDNAITKLADIRTAEEKAASDILAIRAGTVSKIIADRQRDIDNLTVLNEAQQRFFEHGLAGWAAQSRAAGDFAGFFDAQFIAALTKGTDLWSSLTTLAQGSAQDIKSAFSSWLTDFGQQLAAGTLSWKSFTDGLSSLWNSLMNSLIKRFADFLVDMAIRAATSQQGGGFLASLLGAASSTSFAAGSAPGSGTTTIGPGGTEIGNNSGLGGVTSAVNGVGALQGSGSLLQSIMAGWDSGFGGLSGAASGAWSNLTTPIQGAGAVLAGVGTALGIAMIALNDNISDLGKAVESAILAAGFIVSLYFGPIALIAAVAINFILDALGVFEVASESWLKFPVRLAETLGQTQDALGVFGDELTKATNLEGVATSIENLRRGVDSFLPGFFEGTKGLGLFSIPGLPGATGTEHEGGIAIDFNQYTAEIQTAINKVLDTVRDTISVKFVEIANRILPPELAAAYAKGTLGPLREEFEKLVTSADATIEDIKAFEERMNAAAERMAAFGILSQQIAQSSTDAAKIALGGIYDAFTENVIAPLKARLVDLASNAGTTDDQLKAFQQEILAVASVAQQFVRIGQQIAAFGSASDRMTSAVHAVEIAMAQAAQAVQDSRSRMAEALTGPEFAAASLALEKAILDRYALEVKLIQDIQAEINNLLDMAGSLLDTSQIAASAALSVGNLQPLVHMVQALQGLATTADNAAVRLWAANAALAALTASLPGLVERFGAGVGPGDLGGALGTILGQALPSLNALADLFNQAKNAGDLKGALEILNQGASAINALAQAGIAAVKQWQAQALEAAHAQAEAQISSINAVANTVIKGEQARAKELTDANDLRIETNNLAIEGLQAQRSAAQEAAQAAIQLASQWKSLHESVSKMIVDLKLGTSSPLNPRAALSFAESQLSIAEAAFAGAGTPENAAAVQQAIQGVLAAGQNVWTRPSPEWAALFNSMVAKLEGLKAIAGARVTPEESAAASLVSIDSQIAELTAANKALAEDNKLIERNTAAAVAAIELQRDAEIAAVRASEAAQVLAINAAAENAINGINAGLADIMGQIAEEQRALLTTLLGQQIDLLRQITGGMPAQQWLALKAGETVEQLQFLRDDLRNALTGDPLTAPVPFASGGIVTRPTFALIGEDGPEAVVPLRNYAPMVPASRSGESGGTLVIEEGAFVVNISGVSDQEVIADLRRELKDFERRLLNGDIRYRLGLDKVRH